MNLRAAAREAVPILATAGVEDARFEAELLARHAARIDRDAYFREDIEDQRVLKRFECAVHRRARREPAAYILKSREFFGRPFAVGAGVLVPRPETELLVETALELLPADTPATVIDVGTGSGAIAISVALERPLAKLAGIDVSHVAFRYARRNARRLGADIEFVRGSLAGAVRSADIVVANLPYIPSGEIGALDPEVRDWEPRHALDGGPDGLSLIRALVADCALRLRPGALLLEVGAGQSEAVAGLCTRAGAASQVRPDLAGIGRVVVARWR